MSDFAASTTDQLKHLISPTRLDRAINEWLDEDIPSFDCGGAVVGDGPTTAKIYVKSQCVLSGQPFAEAVIKKLCCSVKWLVPEGKLVTPGHFGRPKRVEVGVVQGPANRLLQAERTVLEVLTRSSACASYARRCREAALIANPTWAGHVAATRKTTPGSIRLIEKYGAQVGGADPHRYSLSSMVMLKDNHIDVVGGSIAKAVQQARKLCGFSVKIEVECRSEEDAFCACKSGAEVVMLDNFSPLQVYESAPRIKKAYPYVTVEVSGGVSCDTIGAYALDGVDIISVGKITHGPPPCDISMKIATPAVKNRSKL